MLSGGPRDPDFAGYRLATSHARSLPHSEQRVPPCGEKLASRTSVCFASA